MGHAIGVAIAHGDSVTIEAGLTCKEGRWPGRDFMPGLGSSQCREETSHQPATARETARHIGLSNFTAEQINHRETNIVIGTAYLKRALDDFGGSMSLAAAAYNAGPSRPRSWRNGPVLDAAIWAENVPFGETRDYVKKVLANATVYAAVLSGQPQSLRERLGPIGPRSAGAPPIDEKMP